MFDCWDRAGIQTGTHTHKETNTFTLAEGYGIVYGSFIDLMNLQCELLVCPANHNIVYTIFFLIYSYQ